MKANSICISLSALLAILVFLEVTGLENDKDDYEYEYDDIKLQNDENNSMTDW